MTQIIAIINQKGGVGKTTTTINVATFLQKQGKSVLIVDLDPQSNATSGIGLPRERVEQSTYDVIMGTTSLVDAVQSIERLGIHILPSKASLAAAETDLSSELQRENKLKSALSSAAYDYILIDCHQRLDY